jgi:hypothetical protein
MSDKELQRVTECLAYIGHCSQRHLLPARFTKQKGPIALRPTLLIARLLPVALQYGTSLAKLGNLLSEAKYVTSTDRHSLFRDSRGLKRGGLT